MDRLLKKSVVACALVAMGAVGLEACGGRDQLIIGDGDGGEIPFDDDGVGAGPVDDDGAGAGPNTGGFGGFGAGPDTGGFGGFGAGPDTGGFGGAPSTSVVSSSAVTTSVSSSSGVGGAPATTSVGVGGAPATTSVSSSVTTVGVGGMGGNPSTTSVGVGGAPATTSVGVGGAPATTSVGVGGMGGSGGSGGGNPLDCITCIGNNCPQAVQCVTDPVCVQGTICAVQNCISGGNPDLICVLNCFNGDLGTALLALQSVGCIFNQCGNECTGIFGGGP